MIPELFIDEWKQIAPWISEHQVEQDLVLSRAIAEIYSNVVLSEKLAFRGGTALHKIHLAKALRYSEDLDFIQIDGEPIGSTLDLLRAKLDPWLGSPRREFGEGLVKLLYRYSAEADGRPMKLKVEINSREHFAAQSVNSMRFSVNSKWMSANVQVTTLRLDWLLGSKLRALYQRRKGRDLFDLCIALEAGLISASEIISSFLQHLQLQRQRISRAEFEKNLDQKLRDKTFLSDLPPLLGIGASDFDYAKAHAVISKEIISRLPGEPWKGRSKK